MSVGSNFAELMFANTGAVYLYMDEIGVTRQPMRMYVYQINQIPRQDYNYLLGCERRVLC